jgi:hypothetical protein
MPNSDFLPFATGAGANVENQATYASDPSTSAGFSAGIAQSQKLNKVWRQSSFISSALAQFVMQQLNMDILDDGDIAGFTAKLQSALVALNQRQVLSVALTNYYIDKATGSDNNDGLTPNTPWQTLQFAANYFANHIDFNGNKVVVNVNPGTYAPFNILGLPLGVYDPTQYVYQGNVSNPTTTIISAPNGNCVFASVGVMVQLQGFSFTATGLPAGGFTGNGLWAQSGAIVNFQNCNFGPHDGTQIVVEDFAYLSVIGPYSISGSAYGHYFVGGQSQLSGGAIASTPLPVPPFNVTLSGTPAFSYGFLYCTECSLASFGGGRPGHPTVLSFVGSGATGKRYAVDTNSVIQTYSSGTNLTYFPGSVAGTADPTTFGTYQ